MPSLFCAWIEKNKKAARGKRACLISVRSVSQIQIRSDVKSITWTFFGHLLIKEFQPLFS